MGRFTIGLDQDRVFGAPYVRFDDDIPIVGTNTDPAGVVDSIHPEPTGDWDGFLGGSSRSAVPSSRATARACRSTTMPGTADSR